MHCAAAKPKGRHLKTALSWGVWGYLLAVVGVWGLLLLGGDRWWLATVVLFGPRWLLAIPLAVLVPLAALTRRRMLWPLLLAGVVLLGPILRLCLPWGRLAAPGVPALRVLTCNVDGEAVDVAALAALIRETAPDIVALQECPAHVAWDWLAGWHVHRAGELLIASRYALREVAVARCHYPPGPWPPVTALYCAVESPAGRVGFCNVHFGSPHQGLDNVLDRRTVLSPARSAELEAEIDTRGRESEDAVKWLSGLPEPLIVAGDFNMPTDSAIYRRYWAGYANAFSRCGCGFGYTKWTPVRMLCYGVRIDHVLTGAECRCCRCWVGPDIGSDHLPLIADLTWEGNGPAKGDCPPFSHP